MTTLPPSVVTYMAMEADYMVLGFQDSRAWLVPLSHNTAQLKLYIQIQLGSAASGAVKSVHIMNNQFALIGGADGVLYTVAYASEGLAAWRNAVKDLGIKKNADTIRDWWSTIDHRIDGLRFYCEVRRTSSPTSRASGTSTLRSSPSPTARTGSCPLSRRIS